MKSDTALAVSVSTVSVPNTGHGGTDHAAFVDTNNKNRCPTSPKYNPSPNPVDAGRFARVLTQACPANVISVSPVSTASEATTPTAAPARTHHVASTTQESKLPAMDTAGSPPAPLS